jgi:phage gp46-like protein
MSRYDGDVAVRPSLDGGEITIEGGQPLMEHGLSTAVYLSLWTDLGWWGNALAGEHEEIGSGCEALENEPLSNKVRMDYEEAARQALAWMKDSGIAESVKVEAAILTPTALELTVTIEEPHGAASTSRYRTNWQAQREALGVTT